MRRDADYRGARGLPAYTLTGRGTWLSFQNRGPLEIVFEGDPVLFNSDGIILVNPARHPHVKAEHGQTFIGLIVFEDVHAAIANSIVNGKQLFFLSAE